MPKYGYVPKRFTLAEMQIAFQQLYKLLSTPGVSDLPDMTLAQLNAKITDADVDDDGDPRDPNAHASTHFPNGADDLIGLLVIDNAACGLMVDDTSKTILMWSK